jgi:hypothetical protein
MYGVPVVLFHQTFPATGETGAVALTMTLFGTEDVQPDPVLVRTLPAVPGEVKPVPPLPAGSVPETVDRFTGGRMLERVVMPCSFPMK